MPTDLEHCRCKRLHPQMRPPVNSLRYLLGLLTLILSLPAGAITSQPIVREELFDGPVLRWDILIKRSEIAKLRDSRDRWSGIRPEAVCSVRAGTNLWTNVAVHLKGAAGSFRQFDQNPALTLNFGKLQDGQSCFGHKKLHLNNSVQDAGRMDEILSSEMYLHSGVPTPRATHAFVSINGRYLGIYVLKGGWDKPFLKQHFSSAKGNFYDGAFVQDIDSNLERDSGEGEADWADLQKLREAVREADRTRRLARIGAVLDVDRFVTMAAIQVLVDDWDGYVRNRNNYRIYHDPVTDRLVFMPHGMDQLWRSPRSGFTPRFGGLVAERLFNVPESKNALSARMRDLTNTVFNPRFVDEVFLRAQERLIRALEADRRGDERQYAIGAMRDTRDRIATRMTAFTGDSYQSAGPLRFSAEGKARLADWRPNLEGAGARLEQRTLPDGKKVLFVGAASGGGSGSWRSRVFLESGRYRLEGRARTRDVHGADNFGRGSGAGIRISGARRGTGLDGTAEWRAVRFDFSVAGDDPRSRGDDDPGGAGNGRDIVLVAELQADSGEAEFDLDSLVLTRL